MSGKDLRDLCRRYDFIIANEPLGFDQTQDFFLRTRRTEQEALALVAMLTAQEIQFGDRLDAFRRDRHAKTPAETDNGTDDGLRIGLGVESADE